MDRSPTCWGGRWILLVSGPIAASLFGTGCLIDRIANAYGNIGAGEGTYSTPSPPPTEAPPASPPKPSFVGEGGVPLLDPEHAYRPTGVKETRDLAHFEPVPLGTLGVQRCAAVKVTLGPDAKPNPKADDTNTWLRFQPVHTNATRVEDGAIAARPVCNLSMKPMTLTLELVRSDWAPPPGTGTVTIEAFESLTYPASVTTPFLDKGVLSPPASFEHVPIGEPEHRKLEAFERMPVSVPYGECYSVEVKLGRGAKVDPKATMDTHVWVWADRLDDKAPYFLAQGGDASGMFIRGVCNEARKEPWILDLMLVSLDGKPAGKGDVEVQLVKQTNKETNKPR